MILEKFLIVFNHVKDSIIIPFGEETKTLELLQRKPALRFCCLLTCLKVVIHWRLVSGHTLLSYDEITLCTTSGNVSNIILRSCDFIESMAYLQNNEPDCYKAWDSENQWHYTTQERRKLMIRIFRPWRWHATPWEACPVIAETLHEGNEYGVLLPHKLFWLLKLTMSKFCKTQTLLFGTLHSFKLRTASYYLCAQKKSFEDSEVAKIRSLFHSIQKLWTRLQFAYEIFYMQLAVSVKYALYFAVPLEGFKALQGISILYTYFSILQACKFSVFIVRMHDSLLSKIEYYTMSVLSPDDKIFSGRTLLSYDGNELNGDTVYGALFSNAELRVLAMQGVCMSSYIIGKADDNDFEIIQRLEEMYQMLLGRLGFEKQNLMVKLGATKLGSWPALSSVANEKNSTFIVEMWFRWHATLWEACLVIAKARCKLYYLAHCIASSLAASCNIWHSSQCFDKTPDTWVFNTTSRKYEGSGSALGISSNFHVFTSFFPCVLNCDDKCDGMDPTVKYSFKFSELAEKIASLEIEIQVRKECIYFVGSTLIVMG
ncbi:hypothetical protein BUALT_Bualt02G0009200 [Buddleja alternifolia]|uniref:Uncharacterized protein n=1 Tax=Buddleja alternifolia TaxID=168488 RepID=A0AAV6Y4F6_9LAMI|nr:hypothetical protein BUALT_Bualt02G0009200 [Buddleja alternifolia]